MTHNPNRHLPAWIGSKGRYWYGDRERWAVEWHLIAPDFVSTDPDDGPDPIEDTVCMVEGFPLETSARAFAETVVVDDYFGEVRIYHETLETEFCNDVYEWKRDGAEPIYISGPRATGKDS